MCYNIGLVYNNFNMAPDDDLAKKRASEADVPENQVFEEQRQTVNGITVSIHEFTDYEGDGEKGYSIFFSAGMGKTEEVKLFLPQQYAMDLFELACKSVPPEHPQRLYIAYGIVKQAVEAKRGEADEAAKQQEVTRRATLRARLDTAYTESAETREGPVEIRWMEEAGKDGCFVIVFPKDSRDRRGANVFPATMRPDLAKKFFDYAVLALNKGNRGDHVRGYLKDLQQQISRVKYENRDEDSVLWSQDKDVEFPDIFYREGAEENGFGFVVYWDKGYSAFVIYFEGLDDTAKARENGINDPLIIIDEKTEHAKEVLAYARTKAMTYGKKGIYDLYKDVAVKTRALTFLES